MEPCQAQNAMQIHNFGIKMIAMELKDNKREQRITKENKYLKTTKETLE